MDNNIDIWIFGASIVGGAIGFSALGVWLARRFSKDGRLKRHHEVAGYMLSIVGTLYSVLLGLVVVDTQSKYQEAREMTQREADSALDLFHLAYTAPKEVRTKLHGQLRSYMRTVIDDEWPSILRTGAFNENAKRPFRDIWWTLTQYEPQTGREQNAYQNLLDEMDDFADGRRYRLIVSQQGLPSVMWGVLIAGGTLTVLFTYLFEVEDAKAQVFMTALVTLALSLNLLLVALFNNPYKGYMRITSRPFFYDLKVMQELEMEYHD